MTATEAPPGKRTDRDRLLLDHSRVQLIVKRALDIVVSVLTLIVLSPVLVLAGILIKLDTPGPVIFADKRIGKNGKPFMCLKIRTMIMDGDRVLESYLVNNPAARKHMLKYRKLPDDPRITRIGRILRKSSLDEFPQLINIIRGEMSIVGPRPERWADFKALEPVADVMFAMSPGMAGMWFANGRNELDFETRAQLELEYVRNWSLKLDFVLFWKSLIALLTARGAH